MKPYANPAPSVDDPVTKVAFTPKGGCPLKRKVKVHVYLLVSGSVAFTPKGGCPLKPCVSASGGTDARTW